MARTHWKHTDDQPGLADFGQAVGVVHLARMAFGFGCALALAALVAQHSHGLAGCRARCDASCHRFATGGGP